MTAPRRWLAFAHEDLVLAEAALEKHIPNQACFHAQQGVEKALKGFLTRCRGVVPKDCRRAGMRKKPSGFFGRS